MRAFRFPSNTGTYILSSHTWLFLLASYEDWHTEVLIYFKGLYSIFYEYLVICLSGLLMIEECKESFAIQTAL